MKKYFIIMILAFVFSSIHANKAEILMSESKTEIISEADVQSIAERVNEIESIDMSELSSSERYALKYELTQMKYKINAFMNGGGIYIGGGTLLLIIILLIILL